MLKNILDNKPHIQKHLFEKGFLITNAEIDNFSEYPFYGNWIKKQIHNFNFWMYKTVNFFTLDSSEGTMFLIGHAYNPYTMISDENIILKSIAEAYNTNDRLNIQEGFCLPCVHQIFPCKACSFFRP